EHGTSHLVDVGRAPRARFAEERAILRALRAQRVAPATDRKRVASWNAWTISGLARAGSVHGEPSWLADAVAGAEFVLGRMRDAQGRLLRVYDEGRARVLGFLEDV